MQNLANERKHECKREGIGLEGDHAKPWPECRWRSFGPPVAQPPRVIRFIRVLTELRLFRAIYNHNDKFINSTSK